MTNLETFLATYRAELERNIAENPDEYMVKDMSILFPRMEAAIVRFTFNKDSASFRKTCKVLGIPHTYKAIKAYIGAQS